MPSNGNGSIPREDIRSILVHQDSRIGNLETKFDSFMSKTSEQLEDLSKNLSAYANRPAFDLRSALGITQSLAVLVAAFVATIVYISSNHISADIEKFKLRIDVLDKEIVKQDKEIEKLKEKAAILHLIRPLQRPQ